MKPLPFLFRRRPVGPLAPLLGLLLVPAPVHASLLHGETLDTLANVLSWVVLVLVPVVGITVFWLVHVLPEKIAEKRKHPQTHAIHCLCLLSLFFGGLLWPLAWLWAYSKPVLYKLAYGKDTLEEEDHAPGPEGDRETRAVVEDPELRPLRARVAELEALLKKKGGNA